MHTAPIPLRLPPDILYRYTVPSKPMDSDGFGIGIPIPFRQSRKSYTVPIPFRRKPKSYTVKPYTYISRAL